MDKIICFFITVNFRENFNTNICETFINKLLSVTLSLLDIIKYTLYKIYVTNTYINYAIYKICKM